MFTPIPADYTRLNSFGGGKDTIRQYLLPTGENVDTNIIAESTKGFHRKILLNFNNNNYYYCYYVLLLLYSD